ncbi:uncharacterized protein [Aristolochia californica]|uniref:uncharacterized protein n=1 Tax=Aristolochia californica TaxID=171875 RepID=UPI0035D715D6
MESLSKRPRLDNGGHGSNYRNTDQQDLNYFQRTNGGGDLECRRFNTPEGCPYGKSCRFRHVSAGSRDVGQPSMASGGNPKPCMKFSSTSGCPLGESCHFLHYVPGVLSSLGLTPVVSLSAASSAISQRKPVQPIGNPSITVSRARQSYAIDSTLLKVAGLMIDVILLMGRVIFNFPITFPEGAMEDL